ncbi:hypothetical protein GWZ74_10620 [Vibrio cholerae]|nr:hypothetical protein VCB_001898 [Vibrio cholerae TMA 21]NOE55911.1 hypothetical protein [Vibrio cholerae]NOE86946.1 hypothetical protein [Vibrio cholerae]NOE96345.1 hypothetical protein [Vibrio cholerae]NOF00191.1 hypothetical protein [Vibrio cholerae]
MFVSVYKSSYSMTFLLQRIDDRFAAMPCGIKGVQKNMNEMKTFMQVYV